MLFDSANPVQYFQAASASQNAQDIEELQGTPYSNLVQGNRFNGRRVGRGAGSSSNQSRQMANQLSRELAAGLRTASTSSIGLMARELSFRASVSLEKGQAAQNGLKAHTELFQQDCNNSQGAAYGLGKKIGDGVSSCRKLEFRPKKLSFQPQIHPKSDELTFASVFPSYRPGNNNDNKDQAQEKALTKKNQEKEDRPTIIERAYEAYCQERFYERMVTAHMIAVALPSVKEVKQLKQKAIGFGVLAVCDINPKTQSVCQEVSARTHNAAQLLIRPITEFLNEIGIIPIFAKVSKKLMEEGHQILLAYERVGIPRELAQQYLRDTQEILKIVIDDRKNKAQKKVFGLLTIKSQSGVVGESGSKVKNALSLVAKSLQKQQSKETNGPASTIKTDDESENLLFPSEEALSTCLKQHPLTSDRYLWEKGVVDAVVRELANREKAPEGVDMTTVITLIDLRKKLGLSNVSAAAIQLGLSAALKDCAIHSEK